MLVTYLVSQLIFQAGPIAVPKNDSGESWIKLNAQERCGMLRAVLDSPGPQWPSLSQSSEVRRRAVSKGRLVVSAWARWDIGGVHHPEIFPHGGDAGASICGWQDVVEVEDLEGEEKTVAKGVWQLMVSFYPIRDDPESRLAYWAQLAPSWPLPRGQAVFSGYPPQYGFVRKSGDAWVVDHDDKAAREHVPVGPKWRRKKTR